MAKFYVEFETDNAAFEDDPRYEIERILNFVAGRVMDSDGGKIQDINGNTVGHWKWQYGEHPRY